MQLLQSLAINALAHLCGIIGTVVQLENSHYCRVLYLSNCNYCSSAPDARLSVDIIIYSTYHIVF